MDESDPLITFDEWGVCHHCHGYEQRKRKPKESLDKIIQRINDIDDGRCILGVSGGVDSSYTLLKAVRFGLKPLVVHLDNGWNTNEGIHNIEELCRRLGTPLRVVYPDAKEFKALQIAFLKAGTPDVEIPTDHAIIATLIREAKKEKIISIVTGVNTRTESHGTKAWSNGHRDWLYINSVAESQGLKLRNFPHYTYTENILYQYRFNWVPLLEYIDYNKTEALKELEDYGYQRYGAKHHESVYTRWVQCVYLPTKFGYDKRRSHLSSLIASGQITREEALTELAKPPQPQDQRNRDEEEVREKLGLSTREYEEILHAPPRFFRDFPSYEVKYGGVTKLLKQVKEAVT